MEATFFLTHLVINGHRSQELPLNILRSADLQYITTAHCTKQQMHTDRNV